jgi:hypothetical protein
MVINTQEPMMEFVTPLLPLRAMLASLWGEKKFMLFLQTSSTPFVDEST